MNYLKFRFVKLQLQDGSWKTYNRPSPQRLQRLIKKLNPKNSYMSINRFSQYQEHPTYPNILMEQNGFIDIDGQNFDSKEETLVYFQEVVSYLQGNNLSISSMTRTNNTLGGYQIIVDSKDRAKLMRLIQEDSVFFSLIDSRVFDEKRVGRLPNTWNGNRNSLAVEVDATGTPINLNTIIPINSINYTKTPLFPPAYHPQPFAGGFHSHGMPMANDRGRNVPDTTPHTKTAKGGIMSTLPRHYLVRQMKNVVYWKSSSYVPVVKFPFPISNKRIQKLQKAYSLGDAYHFSDHKGDYVLFPKIVSYRRLEKVYRAFNSVSLAELQSFGLNWFPVSNIMDIEKKEVIPTLHFKGCYESDCNGSYSKPHLKFLSKFFFKNYSNLTGNKPRIYLAHKRTF